MRTEPMYKRYSKETPAGALPLCNFGGLVVYAPLEPEQEAGADFVTAWDFGEGPHDFRRVVVHYTASGRDYITKGGRRYYLDDICRF